MPRPGQKLNWACLGAAQGLQSSTHAPQAVPYQHPAGRRRPLRLACIQHCPADARIVLQRVVGKLAGPAHRGLVELKSLRLCA